MTAAQSTVTAQRGPRRFRPRVLALLAILGPGMIAANAGNDAGGILTYASAGSQFGYRTLFLMVLITVALVVVQEMCSRLGVYTGEGLGGLIRGQFSPRATFVAMTLLLVANAGLTVSEFAGVGAAMEIFGVSRFISVPIAAVFVWALTVLGSYSRAERLFLILTLAFLAYPVAAFLGHPNGHAVLTNLVSPHFPASHAFLVLAVALIGTTITPYMQFYDASAVVDKHITPANYPSERIDSGSGSIWSNIVSIFIIIATAAAIGGVDRCNRRSRQPRHSGPRSARPRPHCSPQVCSAPRCWPRRWCRCRPRTPSRTRSAPHVRCRRAYVKPRCSTASSRRRSWSAPPSPWPPVTS